MPRPRPIRMAMAKKLPYLMNAASSWILHCQRVGEDGIFQGDVVSSYQLYPLLHSVRMMFVVFRTEIRNRGFLVPRATSLPSYCLEVQSPEHTDDYDSARYQYRFNRE